MTSSLTGQPPRISAANARAWLTSQRLPPNVRLRACSWSCPGLAACVRGCSLIAVSCPCAWLSRAHRASDSPFPAGATALQAGAPRRLYRAALQHAEDQCPAGPPELPPEATAGIACGRVPITLLHALNDLQVPAVNPSHRGVSTLDIAVRCQSSPS